MRFIVGLFIFASFKSYAFAELNIRVQYSPIANLVYQLDCVSGVLNQCSRNSFQDLWSKNFLSSETDKALVKMWADLVERYDRELEFESPIAGRFEGVQLAQKIRIASFQSMTVEEYFSRLDLIVIPKDREKFQEVINAFYPEFKKWWKTTAQLKGRGFAREMESLLKSPKIASSIRQFANFYEVKLPDQYTITFNLFYRPEFDESTSGQQIENYSVVEFLPGEKPAQRADIVIHELCHFFFDNSENKKFDSLQKRFESYGTIDSKSAYNLLNETLATTFGNGLINKQTMKSEKWKRFLNAEQSFYNSYFIDKAAKSLLPWMETWLGKSKTLYDENFVAEYIALLEKAFGRELTSPRLLLSELVLVADNMYQGKFRDVVRKSFRASSMYASEGSWDDERNLKSYQQNINLSVLFIVHPSNIDQLKKKKLISLEDYEQVKKKYQNSSEVLYAYKRSPTIPGFIIVAKDYDKAIGLVYKLGALKEGFEGAYTGP